jgi:hypothetical protein
MKTNVTPSLNYWVALTGKTRRYGQCYIHASVRNSCDRFSVMLGQHLGREVRFLYCPWGRSSNKFKVYAEYTDTRKAVPTKMLSEITNP